MLTFNQIIHKSNTKEEPQNGVVGEGREILRKGVNNHL